MRTLEEGLANASAEILAVCGESPEALRGAFAALVVFGGTASYIANSSMEGTASRNIERAAVAVGSAVALLIDPDIRRATSRQIDHELDVSTAGR